MKYLEVGNLRVLEYNGLKVVINYDVFIKKIENEIKNLYMYIQGEEDKNLYFFKKKNVTKDEYVDSLNKIKVLVNRIFCENPDINIFDFLPMTKKGEFALNRTLNISSANVGNIINEEGYIYINYLSLFAQVDSKDKVIVDFIISQSGVDKFEPLFFDDYEKPIIREKLRAIKKANLKPGMIYSDEKHKKFYLFLGKTKFIESYLVKANIKPTELLSVDNFTDDEIENKVFDIVKENRESALKYDYKYNEYGYTYIKLSKKEYETILKLGKTKEFESYLKEFWEDAINNSARYYSFLSYENPLRVFHEEFQYLSDLKSFKYIAKESQCIIDNSRGNWTNYLPGYYTQLMFHYMDYVV